VDISLCRSFDNVYTQCKDIDGDEITVDGTIKLCEHLGVDPEDVVMLAIAYELKSPRMGIWTKQGWIDGWKSLRCAPFPLFHPDAEPMTFLYDLGVIIWTP
jgi:hypothetical protein